MYVLTPDQGQGCTKGVHEKNAMHPHKSHAKGMIEYHILCIMIKIRERKPQIHRQGSVGEKENKKMVGRGRVGAIRDLFRESPSCSLGPRYTFIYRRYL